MAGTGEGQGPALRIDHGVAERRQKPPAGALIDHTVESLEHGLDLGVELHLHGQRRLHHRHHQPARYSVAGHIPDRNRHSPILQGQDVVEISSDLGGWKVSMGQLEAAEPGR